MSLRWQLGALAFMLLGALVLALEDTVRADLVAFYSRYNGAKLASQSVQQHSVESIGTPCSVVLYCDTDRSCC